MIVPFFFALETGGEYDHLMFLYRYYEMAIKHNWPMIAHARYFYDISHLEELGVLENVRKLQDVYNFTIPSQEELDNISQIKIPYDLECKIIDAFPSRLDAWIHLLKYRYEPWETFIENTLDAISTSFNEPIETIICGCSTASLRYVAAKRNIPLIHAEMGCFRAPFYRGMENAYFDFENPHAEGSAERRYYAFLDEIRRIPVPILSRKEILQLFVSPEFQKDIPLMDTIPEYELCVALTAYSRGTFLMHTHMTNIEMYTIAQKQFPPDKLLFRLHPGHPAAEVPVNDNSPTSFHAICKSKRVAAIQSAMLFEALLVGRTACGYGVGPLNFMYNNGIKDTQVREIPLEFLNFVVFCYFAPWPLVRDVEYIRYRLSGPSETDIYIRNYNYYNSIDVIR